MVNSKSISCRTNLKRSRLAHHLPSPKDSKLINEWMLSKEHPQLPKTPTDPAVQFWTKQKVEDTGKEYWLNVATRTPQSETPVLGRGGIIADGMGLGKTLTVLALVLASMKDKEAAGVSNSTLIGMSHYIRAGLMIVCPLSVLSNWQKQIQDHVVNGGLTCYTYHGENKGVTATTLASYDVRLTPPHVLWLIT
jgi:SWI/SNF-related matrix-associated actin-dependent regulator of chromatin subfamily A3